MSECSDSPIDSKRAKKSQKDKKAKKKKKAKKEKKAKKAKKGKKSKKKKKRPRQESEEEETEETELGARSQRELDLWPKEVFVGQIHHVGHQLAIHHSPLCPDPLSFHFDSVVTTSGLQMAGGRSFRETRCEEVGAYGMGEGW